MLPEEHLDWYNSIGKFIVISDEDRQIIESHDNSVINRGDLSVRDRGGKGENNMRDINKSLYLGWKYTRRFVRAHYLFREANSFLTAYLEENCELWGTDNDQGLISVHIFTPNGGYCGYYPSNIFRNDVLRPIARERKYLMDYKSWYKFMKALCTFFYRVPVAMLMPLNCQRVPQMMM